MPASNAVPSMMASILWLGRGHKRETPRDAIRVDRAQAPSYCSHPADVLALDPERLAELVRKASRGREGASICIRSILTQIEALTPIREQLEAEIATLAERIPAYVLTLPGADPLKAVSLFGETDPVETFHGPEQPVAFAGLDPTVFQTGQYDAPRRRISKRGSPFLRRTLWGMALRSLQQEGDLREYWLRKRRERAHHLTAVTAVAAKICRRAWRILTDRRDYLPQPPRSDNSATQAPTRNP